MSQQTATAKPTSIAELEAEEKALAERVDDDDSLVSAWRAKRQEIKQLRNSSAGGLSADLYSDLFVDADRWCAAIDNAEQVGAELADRLAALRTSNAAIDQALERLIAEVHRLIDLCEVPEIDESEWRQREQELRQIGGGQGAERRQSAALGAAQGVAPALEGRLRQLALVPVGRALVQHVGHDAGHADAQQHAHLQRQQLLAVAR